MAALTKEVVYRRLEDLASMRLPVKASTKIYAGAAVGLSSGYCRPLTAGDEFVGFAKRTADNSAVAVDGNINVELDELRPVQVAVSGAAVTDLGKPVFASDDNTFTFVADGNSFVGYVHAFVSSGVIWLRPVVTYWMPCSRLRDPQLTPAVVTVDTTTGPRTYTAAEILGGQILRDPNGAGRSDVLPTAALLVAALKSPRVGDCFFFSICNNADAAETITLTTGAGITLKGQAAHMQMAQNTSGTFMAVITNVGTPAIDLYRC